MYKPGNEDVFASLTKFIIAVPLVILLFALVMKMSNPGFLESRQQRSAQPTAAPPTPTAVPAPEEAPDVRLDLAGPQQCEIETNQASISASILNKQIMARVQTEQKAQYYLLKNDCLYNWTRESSSGTKRCGLSQYMTVLEYMSKYHLLSLKAVSNMIASMGYDKQLADIHYSKAACTSEAVPQSSFALPYGKTFAEPKPSPSPSR